MLVWLQPPNGIGMEKLTASTESSRLDRQPTFLERQPGAALETPKFQPTGTCKEGSKSAKVEAQAQSCINESRAVCGACTCRLLIR